MHAVEGGSGGMEGLDSSSCFMNGATMGRRRTDKSGVLCIRSAGDE